MQVEIYSDVACPWCYVGKARFEQALAAFSGRADVEVSFRPFQLNPGTPDEPQPLYDYYDRMFGPGFRSRHAEVVELGAREGLDFRFDRALVVNTFTAHRLLWLTEQHYGAAVQRDLKDALLRAYFSDGRDIHDHETLVELAAGVGVDAGKARAWLADDSGADEVRAELDHARDLGINAVPTFVFDGRYAVQGAQATETFSQVLARVAVESDATSAPVTETGPDSCGDDGCVV